MENKNRMCMYVFGWEGISTPSHGLHLISQNHVIVNIKSNFLKYVTTHCLYILPALNTCIYIYIVKGVFLTCININKKVMLCQ